MKRSKHSLSHYKLVTCDMGKLIPVGLIEALPGDTIQQATSLLLRMSPLMAPVMHPVSVRLHHWFVPNRLTWDNGNNNGSWEDFITGGKDGLGNGAVFPSNAGGVTVAVGDIADYMGIPPGSYPAGRLNQMPFAAYHRIYNEFYRDEDLIAEVPNWQYLNSLAPMAVSWEKDYFTTARPWSQKGPAVTLPIGSSAPVRGTGGPIQIYNAEEGAANANNLQEKPDTSLFKSGGVAPVANANVYLTLNEAVSGMEADLSNAEPPNIIDVRRAFALQRYQEARAQYGSRYTEYLRYLGIRPQDARLQRPEYLGGGKQTVSFSEVLRTGGTGGAAEPIGEMSGHGIAAMRSNRYRYFCQEHGYILTLLSIRPRSMYNDGLSRTWSRRTKEDYFQKELELIGQQEIYGRELYAQGATQADTWGYQNRYAEYRHEYSKITGEFRTILDHWHLGRKFASAPVLNQAFIECDPSKRIFAEQTQHSCWIMVNHSIQARRMVGNNVVGRVI